MATMGVKGFRLFITIKNLSFAKLNRVHSNNNDVKGKLDKFLLMNHTLTRFCWSLKYYLVLYIFNFSRIFHFTHNSIPIIESYLIIYVYCEYTYIFNFYEDEFTWSRLYLLQYIYMSGIQYNSISSKSDFYSSDLHTVLVCTVTKFIISTLISPEQSTFHFYWLGWRWSAFAPLPPPRAPPSGRLRARARARDGSEGGASRRAGQAQGDKGEGQRQVAPQLEHWPSHLLRSLTTLSRTLWCALSLAIVGGSIVGVLLVFRTRDFVFTFMYILMYGYTC